MRRGRLSGSNRKVCEKRRNVPSDAGRIMCVCSNLTRVLWNLPAFCTNFSGWPLKWQPSQLPFWRTSPLCDTNVVYTPKLLLSSHFSVFCRNKFYFRFVFERPVACIRLLSKYLIFLFCTFLFIIPLCNLSIFALVFWRITFTVGYARFPLRPFFVKKQLRKARRLFWAANIKIMFSLILPERKRRQL